MQVETPPPPCKTLIILLIASLEIIKDGTYKRTIAIKPNKLSIMFWLYMSSRAQNNTSYVIHNLTLCWVVGSRNFIYKWKSPELKTVCRVGGRGGMSVLQKSVFPPKRFTKKTKTKNKNWSWKLYVELGWGGVGVSVLQKREFSRKRVYFQ